jgi:putative SOS response-associated peptidase YedK
VDETRISGLLVMNWQLYIVQLERGYLRNIPFQRRRCLIPADGFYEWKKLDAKTKQPYALSMSDGEPFAFTGLWDAWRNPARQEEWLQGFTIIATKPNELTATVHNRMPVILHQEDYDEWLMRVDGEDPPANLLRPFPADEMKAKEAHKNVGNLRNNHPESHTMVRAVHLGNDEDRRRASSAR